MSFSRRRRLPQGGILMKQMAACPQGQTHSVLPFTVCQHFQHFEELHLSLDHSRRASVSQSVCMRKRFWLFLTVIIRGSENNHENNIKTNHFYLRHTCEQEHMQYYYGFKYTQRTGEKKRSVDNILFYNI